MKRQLAPLLLSGALVATSGAVMAHHSFAMFNQQQPIELVGTVQEFKYVNPHCYIILEVKGTDGGAGGQRLSDRLDQPKCCDPVRMNVPGRGRWSTISWM